MQDRARSWDRQVESARRLSTLSDPLPFFVRPPPPFLLLSSSSDSSQCLPLLSSSLSLLFTPSPLPRWVSNLVNTPLPSVSRPRPFFVEPSSYDEADFSSLLQLSSSILPLEELTPFQLLLVLAKESSKVVDSTSLSLVSPFSRLQRRQEDGSSIFSFDLVYVQLEVSLLSLKLKKSRISSFRTRLSRTLSLSPTSRQWGWTSISE